MEFRTSFEHIQKKKKKTLQPYPIYMPIYQAKE